MSGRGSGSRVSLSESSLLVQRHSQSTARLLVLVQGNGGTDVIFFLFDRTV
jgi:hypothetical protein